MKISHQFRFNGQYFRSTQGAWLNHKDDGKNSVGNTLVNLIHATNILPSPQSKTFKNISTTYTNFYPLTLIARLLLQVWNTTTKLPLIWQIHANVFLCSTQQMFCCFLIGQFTLWCCHNNSVHNSAGLASGNLWRRNQIWRPSAAVQVKKRELWIFFF